MKGGKIVKKSEYQLVCQARGGDIDGFGELYRRHYKGIVAIAFSISGCRHTAEDVAQETFAVACVAIVRLRDPDKFAQWLAGICRNLARKKFRHKKEKQLYDEDLNSVCSAKACQEGPDELADIKQAVWKLPEKAREVIILRYYNDMSYEQIARSTGLSVQAVNGRIMRAKKKIVSLLGMKGHHNEKE